MMLYSNETPLPGSEVRSAGQNAQAQIVRDAAPFDPFALRDRIIKERLGEDVAKVYDEPEVQKALERAEKVKSGGFFTDMKARFTNRNQLSDVNVSFAAVNAMNIDGRFDAQVEEQRNIRRAMNAINEDAEKDNSSGLMGQVADMLGYMVNNFKGAIPAGAAGAVAGAVGATPFSVGAGWTGGMAVGGITRSALEYAGNAIFEMTEAGMSEKNAKMMAFASAPIYGVIEHLTSFLPKGVQPALFKMTMRTMDRYVKSALLRVGAKIAVGAVGESIEEAGQKGVEMVSRMIAQDLQENIAEDGTPMAEIAGSQVFADMVEEGIAAFIPSLILGGGFGSIKVPGAIKGAKTAQAAEAKNEIAPEEAKRMFDESIAEARAKGMEPNKAYDIYMEKISAIEQGKEQVKADAAAAEAKVQQDARDEQTRIENDAFRAELETPEGMRKVFFENDGEYLAKVEDTIGSEALVPLREKYVSDLGGQVIQIAQAEMANRGKTELSNSDMRRLGTEYMTDEGYSPTFIKEVLDKIVPADGKPVTGERFQFMADKISVEKDAADERMKMAEEARNKVLAQSDSIFAANKKSDLKKLEEAIDKPYYERKREEWLTKTTTETQETLAQIQGLVGSRDLNAEQEKIATKKILEDRGINQEVIKEILGRMYPVDRNAEGNLIPNSKAYEYIAGLENKAANKEWADEWAGQLQVYKDDQKNADAERFRVREGYLRREYGNAYDKALTEVQGAYSVVTPTDEAVAEAIDAFNELIPAMQDTTKDPTAEGKPIARPFSKTKPDDVAFFKQLLWGTDEVVKPTTLIEERKALLKAIAKDKTLPYDEYAGQSVKEIRAGLEEAGRVDILDSVEGAKPRVEKPVATKKPQLASKKVVETAPETPQATVDPAVTDPFNGEMIEFIHKSDAEFSAFSKDKVGKRDQGELGLGHYFKTYEGSDMYGKHKYTARIAASKIWKLTNEEVFSEKYYGKDLNKIAEENGYDAIAMVRTGKDSAGKETVVIDQLKVLPGKENLITITSMDGKPVGMQKTPQAAAGGPVAGRDAQTPAPEVQRAVEAPVAAPVVTPETPAATPQRSAVRELIEQQRKGKSVKANIKETMEATGKTRTEVKAEFDAMVAEGIMSRDPRGQYSIKPREASKGAVNKGDIFVEPAISKNANITDFQTGDISRSEARALREKAVEDGTVIKTPGRGNAFVYKWAGTEDGRGQREGERLQGTRNVIESLGDQFQDENGRWMVKVAKYQTKDGVQVGERTEETVLANSIDTSQPGTTGVGGVIQLVEMPKAKAVGKTTSIGDDIDNASMDEKGPKEIGPKSFADTQKPSDLAAGATPQERLAQLELREQGKTISVMEYASANGIKRSVAIAKLKELVDAGTAEEVGVKWRVFLNDAEKQELADLRKEFNAKVDPVVPAMQVKVRSREEAMAEGERNARQIELGKLSKRKNLTEKEQQRKDKLLNELGAVPAESDVRFQPGGREPGPVTRAEVTKQVEDMARKIKGTFTQDRTSSNVVGTLRQGPMRIMVINEAYSEDAAGAVKRLHKGKFDYLMFVNPETGMRTTVNHEMGHVLRDVLNKRERELMAKIGYEVDSRDGDERFAEVMETTEGRNALAEKLKNAAPAEQSVILRGINRIVDFINTVFGTELKHFGSAREFETLAGGIREFGLLRNIGERAEAARAETGAREMPVYHGTPHLFAPEGKFKHGRFRLDKIGTGEGNQAYGWGIYFAEKKETAANYAPVNIPKQSDTRRDLFYSLESSSSVPPIYSNSKDGAIDSAARDVIVTTAMKDNTAITKEWAINLAESIKDRDIIYFDGKVWPQAVRDRMSAIAKGLSSDIQIPTLKESDPSLYRLDIPDDVMTKLLDWDRPLSEQNDYVKRILTPFAEERAKKANEAKQFILDKVKKGTYTGRVTEEKMNDWQTPKNPMSYNGKTLYNLMEQSLGSTEKGVLADKASLEFAKLGIPGNTHGGVSRGGTGAKYVIWDQATLDRIAMLERNGQALDQIIDEQNGDTRLQKAKKLKDSDIEKILVDRYGRGNIRTAWKASGEKDYAAWRKAEAEKDIKKYDTSFGQKASELATTAAANIKDDGRSGDASTKEGIKDYLKNVGYTARRMFMGLMTDADKFGLIDPRFKEEYEESVTQVSGGIKTFMHTFGTKYIMPKEIRSIADKRYKVKMRDEKGAVASFDLSGGELVSAASHVLSADFSKDGEKNRSKPIAELLKKGFVKQVGGKAIRMRVMNEADRQMFLDGMSPEILKEAKRLSDINAEMYQIVNAQFKKMFGRDLKHREYYAHVFREYTGPRNSEKERAMAQIGLMALVTGDSGITPSEIETLTGFGEGGLQLTDMYATAMNTMSQLAMFTHMAPLVTDMKTLMNDENFKKFVGHRLGNITSLRDTWMKSMDQAVKSMGGTFENKDMTSAEFDRAIKKSLGVAAQSFLADPFTAMKQIAGHANYGGYFGWDVYKKALTTRISEDELKKFIDAGYGEIKYRSSDFARSGLTNVLDEFGGVKGTTAITGVRGFGSRVADLRQKAMIPMVYIDRKTAEAAIKMAKVKIDQTWSGPKNQSYYEAVGRLADKAVVSTQNPTSDLTRTGLQRNRSGLVAGLTFMKGGASVSGSAIFSSVERYYNARHHLNQVLANGTDPAEAKKMLADASENFKRQFGFHGLLQSSILQGVQAAKWGAFGLIAKALYGEDDDDDEKRNAILDYGLAMGKNIAGFAPFGDVAFSGIEAFAKGPQEQRKMLGRLANDIHPISGLIEDITLRSSDVRRRMSLQTQLETNKNAKGESLKGYEKKRIGKELDGLYGRELTAWGETIGTWAGIGPLRSLSQAYRIVTGKKPKGD